MIFSTSAILVVTNPAESQIETTISSPVNGQVLEYNSSLGIWQNSTVSISTSLETLSDVQITSPSNNQSIQWNGTSWVNYTPITTLSGLSDAAISSPNTGDVLTYNGAAWANQPITYPTYSLSTLSGVSISSPTLNQTLTYNGTSWVNQTNLLANLGDVYLTGLTDGQILIYSNMSHIWIPYTLRDAVSPSPNYYEYQPYSFYDGMGQVTNVAIGDGAVSYQNSISIGTNAGGYSYSDNVCIGYEARMLGYYGVAIGSNANSSYYGIAIGYGASSLSLNSIAIGASTTAQSYSIAIGVGNSANNYYSVSIGNNLSSIQSYSVAIGNSVTTGYGSVALGQNASASGNNSLALGFYSSSTSGISLGYNSSSTSGISIGTSAQSTDNGISIGNSTQSTNQGEIAFGTNTSFRSSILQFFLDSAPTLVNTPMNLGSISSFNLPTSGLVLLSGSILSQNGTDYCIWENVTAIFHNGVFVSSTSSSPLLSSVNPGSFTFSSSANTGILTIHQGALSGWSWIFDCRATFN